MSRNCVQYPTDNDIPNHVCKLVKIIFIWLPDLIDSKHCCIISKIVYGLRDLTLYWLRLALGWSLIFCILTLIFFLTPVNTIFFEWESFKAPLLLWEIDHWKWEMHSHEKSWLVILNPKLQKHLFQWSKKWPVTMQSVKNFVPNFNKQQNTSFQIVDLGLYCIRESV